MATTHFLPDEAGETKRPDLIAALGILTFINTGFFILIYGIGVLGMLGVSQMPVEEFLRIVEESMSNRYPKLEGDEMEGMMRDLHATGVPLMMIYLLRTVLRLVGALRMWRGHRSGLTLYAGAQVLGLVIPYVLMPALLPSGFLGFFGVLMTVGITALYGSQYKRLS